MIHIIEIEKQTKGILRQEDMKNRTRRRDEGDKRDDVDEQDTTGESAQVIRGPGGGTAAATAATHGHHYRRLRLKRRRGLEGSHATEERRRGSFSGGCFGRRE